MSDRLKNNGADRYKDWWKGVSGHLGGIYPFMDEGDPSIARLDIGRVVHFKRSRGANVELDPGGFVPGRSRRSSCCALCRCAGAVA
jgi:hypothetical protein